MYGVPILRYSQDNFSCSARQERSVKVRVKYRVKLIPPSLDCACQNRLATQQQTTAPAHTDVPAQLSLAFGRLDLREDCLESLLRIKGPEQQSERLHAHLRKCLPHLKLSTELGARHKCAHCKHARVRVQRVSFPTKSLARLTVERPEPTRREVLGNVSQDDALREPLADGRLADALHMTELRLRARQMRRERVTAAWIVYFALFALTRESRCVAALWCIGSKTVDTIAPYHDNMQRWTGPYRASFRQGAAGLRLW